VASPSKTGPAFDSERARVSWSVAGAGGGATPAAVERALVRVSGTWTQCYRTALGLRGERVEGSGVLHLATDEAGNVIGARLRGFDAMPGVQSCIANAAHVRIDGVDTGAAWADVELSFRVE
jgi:hypothetical protein